MSKQNSEGKGSIFTRKQKGSLATAFALISIACLMFAYAAPGDVSLGGATNTFSGDVVSTGTLTAGNLTLSSGVQPGAPSFTIYVDGANYVAKAANGTVCWTSTDATTVINASVYALPVVNGFYQGKIVLTQGFFLSNKSLVLPVQSAIEICGAGPEITTFKVNNTGYAAYNSKNAAIIYNNTGTPYSDGGWAETGVGMTVYSQCARLSIHDLTIDTSNDNYLNGLSISNTSILELNRLFFRGFYIYENATHQWINGEPTSDTKCVGIVISGKYGIMHDITNIHITGYSVGAKPDAEHIHMRTVEIGSCYDDLYITGGHIDHEYDQVYCYNTWRAAVVLYEPAINGALFNELCVEGCKWGVVMFQHDYGSTHAVFQNVQMGTPAGVGGGYFTAPDWGFFNNWDFYGTGFDKYAYAVNSTATTWTFNHNLYGAPAYQHGYVMATFNSTSVTGYTWTANATAIVVTATTAPTDANVACSIMAHWQP